MYLARSAAPGRLNRCSNVQYGRRQSKIRSQQSDQPSPPPPAETPPSKEHDLQLPRDVIEQLRTTVFSFNTFFVTGVENFEANGVLFKVCPREQRRDNQGCSNYLPEA